ncbi:hypothetical protein ASG82_11485 [Mycobacterium sp. Soil538]|nr:hypothetical protein ASG82_11485 [Mycobacterium sp. Soil538]
MSSPATSLVASRRIDERLDVLFDELAELAGQRNAIDGRIVSIFAEIDRDGLWAAAGARSVENLVAWKTGVSTARAKTVAAVAHRIEEFPRCVAGLQEGQLSLDQVGAIAARAGKGSDEHYAELARTATVNQLRTALKLEPKPTPEPEPEAQPEPEAEAAPKFEPVCTITHTSDEQYAYWQIRLPHVESAMFDAALQSHKDALITQWNHDRDTTASGEQRPPMPTTGDAFLRLIQAGWDADAAARPHGQRTTVVVHIDVKDRVGALHLGPLLSDADRQYLTCDATCEVWFERDGRTIGAGRSTRTVNRRLRRALEFRDRTCVVPGCGATRGLHAHHLKHWEDGGLTELINLALVCPYHHRAHHRGLITITGPADRLVVADHAGRPLTNRSLARPPTQLPPDVAPCPGPTGERAHWWWYEPFDPQRPPSTN